MARELLLLESSDWQFLITTWSARDYAENRIALHYDNFSRLYIMTNTYANGQNLMNILYGYILLIVPRLFQAY
ncbi:hypothetical protein LCGC14_2373360 [marine sediment metagenome]|uniref:1,4-alpha-glucan branching enzyme C-terminal domain-containing protein n=1 Tax=marine sediment metagenome TaxID=412755 RepID=A0A0F9EXP8_9ZZZZ